MLEENDASGQIGVWVNHWLFGISDEKWVLLHVTSSTSRYIFMTYLFGKYTEKLGIVFFNFYVWEVFFWINISLYEYSLPKDIQEEKLPVSFSS